MSDYQTFAVPYDFSEHAAAALEAAAGLASRLGADLHLVHVIPMPAYAYSYGAYGEAAMPPTVDMAQVRKEALGALERVKDDLRELKGQVHCHVVDGIGIADAVCETAEEIGADLIVMGTHGRTGLAHVFLGSVAERTLRRAPCPVLTVQARDSSA